MKLYAADVGKAKAVEGKDNVLDMQGCWDDVGFEDDHASIIPFAKAKANILIAVGSDDKIGNCDRQVRFSSHRRPLKLPYDFNNPLGPVHLSFV